MAEEPITVNEATPNQSPPEAEAKTPAGTTVTDLQAQIAELESKYNKEIGDRDRGMARQANELKTLRSQLELAEKAADAVARKVYGEDSPPEESEYQRWKKQHSAAPGPQSEPSPTPKPTAEHLEATGQMKALADIYNVNYNNPPQELAGLVDKVTALYWDKPGEAVKEWKTGLKKRDEEAKAKSLAEEKAKHEEANRKAKLGQRDASQSTGGGQSDYRAIAEAYRERPDDPATRDAYLAARRARGI